MDILEIDLLAGTALTFTNIPFRHFLLDFIFLSERGYPSLERGFYFT
jgi:hypothetical protein